MRLTDYMCQGMRDEENLPALKTVLTHRGKDSKDCIEKRGGRLVTEPETILTTEGSANRKWPEIKNGKKNNTIDILSDISHEKTGIWLRRGNHKRETESLLISAHNNDTEVSLDEKIETKRSIKKEMNAANKHRNNTRLDMTGWASGSAENCKKFKFDHANKWYMHNPESDLENKTQNSSGTLRYKQITWFRPDDQTL